MAATLVTCAQNRTRPVDIMFRLIMDSGLKMASALTAGDVETLSERHLGNSDNPQMVREWHVERQDPRTLHSGLGE